MIHISTTQRNPEKEADGPFENNSIQDEEDSMQEQAMKMRKLFNERETKLMSELQDAKDQAELLEFRVLELEEEQEEQKQQVYTKSDLEHKKEEKDPHNDTTLMDRKFSDA